MSTATGHALPVSHRRTPPGPPTGDGLADYIRALKRDGLLADVDAAWLKRHGVKALDANGDAVHQWTIWDCLVGEIVQTSTGDHFILGEGELFTVDTTYLAELDRFLTQLTSSAIALPTSSATLHEKDYNESTASACGYLLLDRKTVKLSRSTTPIEICDLLTPAKSLVHVKRHLGSSDPSHLFAQGAVSAELLQSDNDFRHAAATAIAALPNGSPYAAFLPPNGISPADFQLSTPSSRTGTADRSPKRFPSSARSMRRAVEDLQSRAYRVAYAQIQTTIP